ncbi:MAG: RluA family pseudouridine synthase, partial [Rhodospirillaceae bacterium]|nr:RluA family pseudouridine synthase [Rhodospirillaceae bacterium]
MSPVQIIEVAPEEAALRLDRWFKRRFPQLDHGRLERLLRTGQVRVDGRRAAAGLRLEAGQKVRVPPLGEAEPAARPAPRPPAADERMLAALRRAVLYRDEEVLAIDKPPGLAVQGGTETPVHLDLMLDGLRFGAAERPRLVHRLDKDTSGVLLLARTARAAAWLAEAFRRKEARKVYWAVTVGVPHPPRGRIDLPLGKLLGRKGERVAPIED